MHTALRGDAQNGAKGARGCGGMAGARAGRRRAAGVGGGVCRGACVGCAAPWEWAPWDAGDLVKLQLTMLRVAGAPFTKRTLFAPLNETGFEGGDNARSALTFSAV